MRIRLGAVDTEIEVTSGGGLVGLSVIAGAVRIRAEVKPEDARRIADLLLDAARSAHDAEGA